MNRLLTLAVTRREAGMLSWPHPPEEIVELEVITFLEEGEREIDGREMLRRAQALEGCLAEQHARALLINKQRIPETWRRFELVFPEAIKNDPKSGYVCIASLVPTTSDERWAMVWDSLDPLGWGEPRRIVRPRQLR